MNRQNRRPAAGVLPLLGLMLCTVRVPADDGSWSTQRGYAPAEGALYSEAGNPDVVMEKEYLELRDARLGSTRAVFQFRNTRSAPVTVECAFPVRFDFNVRQISLDAKGGLVPDTESATRSDAFPAWDFGDVLPSRYASGNEQSPQDKGFVKDILAALTVPTFSWDSAAALKANEEDPDLYYAGTCFRNDEYPRGRMEVDAAGLLKLIGFRILQNGKELPVRACVAEFGAEPGHVVLHFRHQLSFAAGAASTVSVTYAMPTGAEVSGDQQTMWSPGISRRYTWKYILETASSWKDSLGRIVLALPPNFESGPAAPWRYMGTKNGQLLYGAENWKPTPRENLSLDWRFSDKSYVGPWRETTESLDPKDLPTADNPARVLGASSFLPDKADVFLRYGVWRNAPFDAARLFDGFPETAWAVRTAKGGVGEYVRFTLDSAVNRLEVFNGYQRSMENFPDKDTWSYYGKNNRVKTFDILKEGGSLAERIQLADTREVQRFNVSLPAGNYRVVITGIYKGSRWNDTCLGELRFVRGTAAGLDTVSSDLFFGPLLK